MLSRELGENPKLYPQLYAMSIIKATDSKIVSWEGDNAF